MLDKIVRTPVAEDLYKTSDIYEAAFLLCNGIEKVKKESYRTPAGHERCWIFFKDKENALKLSEKFYSDLSNNVNARRFIDSYKVLKRYVFKT